MVCSSGGGSLLRHDAGRRTLFPRDAWRGRSRGSCPHRGAPSTDSRRPWRRPRPPRDASVRAMSDARVDGMRRCDRRRAWRVVRRTSAARGRGPAAARRRTAARRPGARAARARSASARCGRGRRPVGRGPLPVGVAARRCSGWAGWASRPGVVDAASPQAARRAHPAGAASLAVRCCRWAGAGRRAGCSARSSPSRATAWCTCCAPPALGAGDVKLAAPLGAVLARRVLGRARARRGARRRAHRRGRGRRWPARAARRRARAVPHGPSMLAAAWLVTLAAAVGAGGG